jgi:hypothetical protein
MPPKRRTAAKGAPAPAKGAPAPAKSAPTPPPAKQAAPPPPPPPSPPSAESRSNDVRKEWLNFISTWYEPQKKKLVDQLTKDLDAKYKKSSSSRIQQSARHAEQEEKLSEITTRLAEPAHEEWNNRLAAAQLLVNEWINITEQEQQSVIDVFKAFYEDNEEEEDSTPLDSSEVEESVASTVEEPQLGDSSPFFTMRQSPPTPITANFEFVNPSSFFTDTKQARKLPELAMVRLEFVIMTCHPDMVLRRTTWQLSTI